MGGQSTEQAADPALPQSRESEEYWRDLPSLKELRAAIPQELFVRSLPRSMMHLAIDTIQIFTLIYLGLQIPTIPYEIVRYVLWPLYWFALGTAATGWWVLAHECGHQGFSAYRTVNHTVGLILHSILLVPYHSWRISHGLHHKYNASIERDQVYVPTEKNPKEKKSSTSGIVEALGESPIFGCLVLWVLGWPLYLLFNVSGPKVFKSEAWPSHFNPYFKMYQSKHRSLIILSDLGLVLWCGVLYMIAQRTSWETVLFHYFLPYLWVNFWLVTYTYLQHTDIDVPHFRTNAWTFERGSSSTIDRDYGALFNYLHHHIGDSHVVHHYFSTMPFYNAIKATPYLKKALGKYYFKKDERIVPACLKAWAECKYVSTEGDIVQFKTE
jgi:omega-6 fatty acid desaturase (delta-12 desaturase)